MVISRQEIPKNLRGSWWCALGHLPEAASQLWLRLGWTMLVAQQKRRAVVTYPLEAAA